MSLSVLAVAACAVPETPLRPAASTTASTPRETFRILTPLCRANSRRDITGKRVQNGSCPQVRYRIVAGRLWRVASQALAVFGTAGQAPVGFRTAGQAPVGFRTAGQALYSLRKASSSSVSRLARVFFRSYATMTEEARA